MKYAKVLESGAIQFVMETDATPPDYLGFKKVPAEVTPETHWVLNDSVVAYRSDNHKNIPSYPCNWCPRTETWQDARGIDELLSAKLIEIEKERDRRLNAPIEFSEISVDADPNSQLNITTKLRELVVAEELGVAISAEDLFWRDSNNQNQVFNSVKEMKTWLQGLIGAISARTTAIYSWSWQMKQKAREAKDKAELSAVTWQ